MVNLPRIEDADLKDKIVLVRVDHNVVKSGVIDDPDRITKSKPTIDYILKHGGKPILMTHIGRPRDQSGIITITDHETITPVADYLEEHWNLKVAVPEADTKNASEKGLQGINESIRTAVENLKAGNVDIVYLPNTRWYEGEEASGIARNKFIEELASLADVFVNDAFGSHQAHASTQGIPAKLPSYAGILLKKEIDTLYKLLHIKAGNRPFIACVGGVKINTKIGALASLRKLADHVVLGGLPLNAVLCAKYGVIIQGINQDEIAIAQKLLEEDTAEGRLLIPTKVFASPEIYSKEKPVQAGGFRKLTITDTLKGEDIGYVYDTDPAYFDDSKVRKIFTSAATIFTNAVFGFDKGGFTEGTIAFLQLLSQCAGQQYFGGGDTLKALKKYTPDFYSKIFDNPKHYTLFTGGGTILNGFECHGVEEMPVIKALLEGKFN